MDFKPVRRVVIGHDQAGKAVALYDSDLKPIQRSAGEKRSDQITG